MIRTAKMADIPGIIALLEEGFRLSHYAKVPGIRVDIVAAKRLLINAIGVNEVLREGGCLVKVIERGQKVCGLLVSTLQPIYLVGNKLCATNLFWFIGERARPTDGALLMVAMIHWA